MSEELRHIINMLHLVGYTEYGGQLTLTISECRLIFEYIKQLNDNIKGEQHINIDNLSKKPSSAINKLYEIKDYYFDLACTLLYEKNELFDKIMNCIKYIDEHCIDDEFICNLSAKEKGILEARKILIGDQDEKQAN